MKLPSPPPTLALSIGIALGSLASPLLIQSGGQRNVVLTGPDGFGTGLTPMEKEILSHMSLVHEDDGQGGTVKTVRIAGVNLQLVNGLGATNGLELDPDENDPGLTVVNGTGNLIVGYNELGNPNGNNRTGSHNLIVGHGNNFASFGGVGLGRDNGIGGAYACTLGGTGNRGLGDFAVIAGGRNGTASGTDSSVHGGLAGTASGLRSTVIGGSVCTASGESATVSGGNLNVASGIFASVTGGEKNEAMGFATAVTGGEKNDATANYAAVAGGSLNLASGNHSAVVGGESNTAEGFWAVVSGGRSNVAGPPTANHAVVSGGNGRATVDSDDWAAGSLLEDN